jgi:hypothetical protein
LTQLLVLKAEPENELVFRTKMAALIQSEQYKAALEFIGVISVKIKQIVKARIFFRDSLLHI